MSGYDALMAGKQIEPVFRFEIDWFKIGLPDPVDYRKSIFAVQNVFGDIDETSRRSVMMDTARVSQHYVSDNGSSVIDSSTWTGR